MTINFAVVQKNLNIEFSRLSLNNFKQSMMHSADKMRELFLLIFFSSIYLSFTKQSIILKFSYIIKLLIQTLKMDKSESIDIKRGKEPALLFHEGKGDLAKSIVSKSKEI